MNVSAVEVIVKKLGSILGSGTVDQAVYILHATFNEFLLRKSLTIERKTDPITGHEDIKIIENKHYINKAEAEHTALRGCLSNVIARRDLVFNICSLESSFLMNEEVVDMDHRIRLYITNTLRYTCLNWTSHLEAVTCNRQDRVELPVARH